MDEFDVVAIEGIAATLIYTSDPRTRRKRGTILKKGTRERRLGYQDRESHDMMNESAKFLTHSQASTKAEKSDSPDCVQAKCAYRGGQPSVARVSTRTEVSSDRRGTD